MKRAKTIVVLALLFSFIAGMYTLCTHTYNRTMYHIAEMRKEQARVILADVREGR